MLILLNIVMMTFMCTLDSSIVNVALPVMAKKLEVSSGAISWVVTSYLITISAAILIFGRLGDIKGKIKVFKAGIVLFTAGSVFCGLSQSFALLIISRVIQAIGAAAAMAVNQGIITEVFPRTERGRALGISGSFVALGSLTGPPLGGFIISVLSWHYIFLINLPVGVFTFIMGMKILPKTEKSSSEKLDTMGALLFTLTIVSLFSSIILGQNNGYTHPAIIAGFLIAVPAAAAFILLEVRTETPLLQLNIFKNLLFSLSILCGYISFVAIFCSNIIQPFYLQDVMKLSPGTTGLIMMTYPLVLVAVAPVSGHLSDKIGSEILTFFGLMLTSAGLFLMSTLNEHSAISSMVAFIAVMSIGNGLFQSPNNSLIMSTVKPGLLGIAGSVNGLIRNLGMVSGIALSTTLLFNRMSRMLGYKVMDYVEGREDVFIYAMRFVYITAGIICAVGAIMTALRLYRKRLIVIYNKFYEIYAKKQSDKHKML